MATKIATTITTTMRNLLRAHHVRVCVHHNNNGKHSVLVPFETGRRVKTKRTKPSRSEEDTKRARGRFSNSRAHRAKSHVAVCKKMRFGARRKRHDHRTQRRTSSWSRVVSLSFSFSFFLSLFLCALVFDAFASVQTRARACVFYSREKVERFESSFESSFFFEEEESQTNHSRLHVITKTRKPSKTKKKK